MLMFRDKIDARLTTIRLWYQPIFRTANNVDFRFWCLVYVSGCSRWSHCSSSYRRHGKGWVQNVQRSSLGNRKRCIRWFSETDPVSGQPGLYSATLQFTHSPRQSNSARCTECTGIHPQSWTARCASQQHDKCVCSVDRRMLWYCFFSSLLWLVKNLSFQSIMQYKIRQVWFGY